MQNEQVKRIRISPKAQKPQDKKQVLRLRFNTKAATIKESLTELRQRACNNPAFLRLLELAAYRSMTKGVVLLSASNPRAMRALRLALASISRNKYQAPTLGKSFRTVYEAKDGRTWSEISKRRADELRNETTPDSIAVREVIAYHPKITRAHAALLDRKTHGEIYAAIRDVIQTQRAENINRWQAEQERSTRDGESAHAELHDERLEYDAAGQLESHDERKERLEAEREKNRTTPRRETWENAERHISACLKKTPEVKAQPRVIELGAAPYYYSSADKIRGAAAIMRDAESEARRLNRLELDADAAEVIRCNMVDRINDSDDLEQGMLSPAQALAQAGF